MLSNGTQHTTILFSISRRKGHINGELVIKNFLLEQTCKEKKIIFIDRNNEVIVWGLANLVAARERVGASSNLSFVKEKVVTSNIKSTGKMELALNQMIIPREA